MTVMVSNSKIRDHGFLDVLRHIPWAYNLARAAQAHRGKNISRALKHYERAIWWAPPEPWTKAFYAQLMVLEGRHDEARKAFRAAIDAVRAIEEPADTSVYALNYSRYYMAIYTGRESERFRTAALATSPSSFVRRCLPLDVPPKS